MLQVADLPFAVKGLVGASLNNVIYMFGENFIIQIKIIISGIRLIVQVERLRGKGTIKIKSSSMFPLKISGRERGQ